MKEAVKNTGDEIAGATGVCVKLRAERKLGGSAEALAPQSGADRTSGAGWKGVE